MCLDHDPKPHYSEPGEVAVDLLHVLRPGPAGIPCDGA
jgi:hypothetical protein